MSETALSRQDTQIVRMDPQALLAQALETGAGIETVERLVALAKDVRAELAKEAWYRAMAEFQRSCPRIKKTESAKIQTRGGSSYSYRYAPLDEIMSVIQPVMGPLGLSVSWRSRVEPDKVVVTCRISHTLGHQEESGEIGMPIVQGDGTGATPPQRVGIAATYAKRYSLLGIIGMAPEDDDDAHDRDEASPRREEPESNGRGSDSEAVINENQVRRLSAIAGGAKWSDDEVHTLLTGYRYNSRKDVRVRDYEAICDRLKLGPKEGLKARPNQGTLA